MIGLWSYTNFRLRNKECEVLLGGIVFFLLCMVDTVKKKKDICAVNIL